MRSICFNVMWNIWREVAKVGIFLLPFFLGEGSLATPLSALAGTVLSLFVGIGIYFANKKLEKKGALAFFMSDLTGFLSVGLFVGGCHTFEEVWGETRKLWKINYYFWSHKIVPMALVKTFGYFSSRTLRKISYFWCWVSLTVALHA